MIEYTGFSKVQVLPYCLSILIIIATLPGSIISQGMLPLEGVKIQVVESVYFLLILLLSFLHTGKSYLDKIASIPAHMYFIIVLYALQVIISAIFHDLNILLTVILHGLSLVIYFATYKSIERRIFLNVLYGLVVLILVVFAINLVMIKIGLLNPFDKTVTSSLYVLKDNMTSYDYFFGKYFCLITPLNLLSPETGNILIYFNEPHNLHFFLLPSLVLLWQFKFYGHRILSVLYIILYAYSVSITTLIVFSMLLFLLSYRTRILLLLTGIVYIISKPNTGLIGILYYKLFEDNSSLVYSLQRQQELFFSTAVVGEGVWMIDMLEGDGAGFLTSCILIGFVMMMIQRWLSLYNNQRMFFLAFGYILLHGFKIYNAFYTSVFPILYLSIILDLSKSESIKDN